jgi:photosystem II stability/assembly factor-like uncharacterized protein
MTPPHVATTVVLSLALATLALPRSQTALPDGAANELRFVAQPSGGPHYLRGQQFIDERHAWVGLYRTTDAGRSWELVLPPTRATDNFSQGDPDLAHTYFSTAARGWIVSLDRGGRYWTWQTEDGGNTWRRWGHPGGVIGAFFLDDGHGWANVYDNVGNVRQGYRTADRGRTWSSCGTRSRGTGPRDATFVSPQDGWAVLPPGALPCTTIVKTRDGGCTWSQVADTRALKQNPPRWVDLYFLDDRNGWLLGTNPGVLLRTSDGGLSWRRALLPRPNFSPESVYFSSLDDGWVSGLFRGITEHDSGVFHTLDGGATWKQLTRRQFYTGTAAIPGRSLIPTKWKEGKLMQLAGATTFLADVAPPAWKRKP